MQLQKLETATLLADVREATRRMHETLEHAERVVEAARTPLQAWGEFARMGGREVVGWLRQGDEFERVVGEAACVAEMCMGGGGEEGEVLRRIDRLLGGLGEGGGEGRGN